MVEDREPVLPFGSFLFPRVFRAFRMSIQPTKLVLAFLALAAVCLTGRIMDLNKTVAVVPGGLTELDVYALGTLSAAEYADAFENRFGNSEEKTGLFTTLWNFGAKRFHGALTALAEGDILSITRNVAACYGALLWSLRYHTLYSIIFFSIALAVMSLAGGAICRIAALQFAQGEKPGLIEAVHFGRRKFLGFLMAPVTPLGIIVFIGSFIILLGLFGNIAVVGELAVGLFLPLTLIAAALTAIFAIGVLAGFNLMFPAIAYEDSDAFDAASRSFSYIYAKPWHMGFYTFMAMIYGALCYAFVRFFSFLLLWTTRQFLEVGFVGKNEKLNSLWPEPTFTRFLGSAAAAAPPNWSMSVGAFLVHVWVLCVVGLMVSFVISFYFSANTIIYALMRNRADKTALHEIYTGTEQMLGESSILASEGETAATSTAGKPADTTEPKPETSE